MNKNRKFDYCLWLIGLVPVCYASSVISGYWYKGINIFSFLELVPSILENPFKINPSDYLIKGILVGIFVYGLCFLYWLSSIKKFRFGEEHGSADFMSAKQLSKTLGDKKYENNTIFTQNAKISINDMKTRLNNNCLIIGGAGSGKTRFALKPNLMNMNSSYIITDPDGGIMRSTGEMFKKNGYVIKVFNLVDMNNSNKYNPFKYVRKESDITKLIQNLIKNTSKKNNSGDEFWTKAEAMLLESWMLYIWKYASEQEKNWATILTIWQYFKVEENGLDTPVHLLFEEVRKNNPDCKSLLLFDKAVKGADETITSIIKTLDNRLFNFKHEEIESLLSEDEIDIEQIGKEKTVVFCVIPDSDKTFNFLIGMLYTQMFMELYYQADFVNQGRLNVPVRFMLDEFANVALPEDFCSLLSTMRKRAISSVIVIQNLAQIKAMFKDTWETITGNCDNLLYLGGNEQSTHEYISKRLGKQTIDKRSTSLNRGKNGSSSKSEDTICRDLMTSEEVGRMSNNKAILIVRGNRPIIDNKFNIFKHKNIKYTADYKCTFFDVFLLFIKNRVPKIYDAFNQQIDKRLYHGNIYEHVVVSKEQIDNYLEKMQESILNSKDEDEYIECYNLFYN